MATTVNDVTSTTSTAAAQMKEKLGMNKDDFLKLFITQLQNQDPLAPQDPTAMLGQLAQLTQVEQAYNSTAALEKLLAAQDSSLAMGAVSLIGKQVSADGNQINFNGSDSPVVSYQAPSALSDTTMTITDASGKVLRTITLGAVEAGNKTYQWDGKDAQGNLLPAGAYNYSVSGTNALGQKQQAATMTTGTADGVQFSNGVAYVTIGAVTVPFNSVLAVKAL